MTSGSVGVWPQLGFTRRNAYKLHTQHDGLFSICMNRKLASGSTQRRYHNDRYRTDQNEGTWNPVWSYQVGGELQDNTEIGSSILT
jgi:hypothetical protein